MTREEAMEIAKKLYNDSLFLKKDKEAMLTLIPELAENDDERMCKAALEGIEYLERKLGWDFIGDIDILDVKEYLEKKKEQKPTVWSDNDDYYKRAIIVDLNGLYSTSTVEQYRDLLQKEMEWLDQLPERFVLQPKIEWTEKDDYIYSNIYSLVKENIIDPNKKQCVEECLKWLASFKEKLTNK